MKNPIKKFTDIFKNNEEVLETINLDQLIYGSTELNTINDILNRLSNKKISFVVNAYNRTNAGKEIKGKCQGMEFILSNAGWHANIIINKTRITIDIDSPIKIYGKRTITKEDPYGEENWEDN